MVETSEVLFLVVCFFFSGFYSSSEAVLMSIGIDRARQMIEQGGSRGRVMTFMVEKSNEILSTILVGNNIANILAASLVTIITSRIFKSEESEYKKEEKSINALSLYWLFLFIVWLVFFTIMFAYNDTVIEFCKSLIA